MKVIDKRRNFMPKIAHCKMIKIGTDYQYTKRDFYLDVYTVLIISRVQLSILTIYAFRVLNFDDDSMTHWSSRGLHV